MSTNDLEAAGTWVDRLAGENRRSILLALLLLAALVRIIYFVQLSASPLVDWHRWGQTDMYFFDLWAKRVAAGDVLTNQDLHPILDWHRTIARGALTGFPAESAATIGEGLVREGGEAAENALWDVWWGGTRFHQGPLYPYAIAASYKLLGTNVRWVFAWQMLAGLLGVLLVFRLTGAFFGEAAAAVAGLMAACYAPLVFYEMLLLRTSLMAIAGLVLAWLAHRASRGTSKWAFLALGLACALTYCLKPTFLLFFLGSLVMISLTNRASRPTWRPAAFLLLGFVIGLGPLAARNVAVGAPILSSSSLGALALPVAAAGDTVHRPTITLGSEHAGEVMVKSRGRFGTAAVLTLGSHESPFDLARGLAKRFVAVWSWFEYPNNANFYYFGTHAPVLRWLPFTFLIVAPLALVGLVLTGGRWRTSWPLLLLVLTHLAPLVVFGILSRYRVPLAVAMLPFAGWTVAHFAGLVIRRRRMAAGCLALVLLVLGVFAVRPLADREALVRPIDVEVGDWLATLKP